MPDNYIHESEVMEGHPLCGRVDVTTDPTPLPATPLAGRNMLIVRNGGTADLILCNANGDPGITLEPSDEMRFVTRDSEPIIYAKVAADTGTAEIMEWK